MRTHINLSHEPRRHISVEQPMFGMSNTTGSSAGNGSSVRQVPITRLGPGGGGGGGGSGRGSPAPPGRMMMRKTSVEEVGERVVNMLDEIENRIEMLRHRAHDMEQEKEQLMEMLSTMMMNKDLLRMGQGERADMEATMNRLFTRCRTVDVQVNTPRNPEQQRALSTVTQSIEGLIAQMQKDLLKSKDLCDRWLNTCDPDQPPGPIDQKFQSTLMECTAEDQKKIRRKLNLLRAQIERAEKAVAPIS